MSALFKATALIINDKQFCDMKPGQWVRFDSGVKGQFMGVTRAGVVVIRYQKGGNFNKTDARANKPLRQYAKIYG